MSNAFVARASWLLLDQGVVSAGNLLLNVLLARTLPEADYGESALFVGATIVLRAVDYSSISHPLAVRLCTTPPEERPALRSNTLMLAAILGVALLLVMVTGMLLLHCSHLLVPACLCYVCWQAQETARR